MFAPPSARRNFFKCATPNLKSWIRPCKCKDKSFLHNVISSIYICKPHILVILIFFPLRSVNITFSENVQYGSNQVIKQACLHSLKIMEPRPIGFKEWRDTRTFSNLKSTHCTLIILLIINLVTKKFK